MKVYICIEISHLGLNTIQFFFRRGSDVLNFADFFFLAIPLLGLRVSPFALWVPTPHTEGLEQSEVSSVQPASLRLRWIYVSAIFVCSGPLDFRLVIQLL